jgi:hypothetical protein
MDDNGYSRCRCYRPGDVPGCAVHGNGSPKAIMFALVAKLTEIDGSPVVDEDMLEVDLQGVLALAAEAVGNMAPPSALSSHASSTSSSERVN